MNRDQLSNFTSSNPSGSRPSNFSSILIEPASRVAKSCARQQVFDRILENISEQDLIGKSYVEHYLCHKYRRNCKSNTLRQAAISLVQFLSFFANRGNIVLEQISREDIEAFVEALQDRGLKPATVNTVGPVTTSSDTCYRICIF